MSLVLPQDTIGLIGTVDSAYRHPGLQFDKFSVPGDQIAQKAALEQVCRIPGDRTLLAALVERRNDLLGKLAGACLLACTTTGPLTLHLARASALENAGICLHPLYGFAYLPGSGLKGMARAYAETVWQPAQSEEETARRRIEDVFGWTPSPDRRRVRRENDDDPDSHEIRSASGQIVFHDAWPVAWPALVVDIVNNHHPRYYMPPDDGHEYPPGDWENPKPVYFLAVKPRTTFRFALSNRRAHVPDDLLGFAQEWLLGALCHLGAGAKTAAGYGAFQPENASPPVLSAPTRAVFETNLELVTPAFLAGAGQQAEDCDLRPATLRGHLRWWWRTMHAGLLDVETMRALEAAIWGDTRAGGAVRIVLEKLTGPAPQPYDRQDKANSNDEWKTSDYGIPGSDPRKTSPGLWYLTRGMEGRDRPRFVLEPPAAWRLRLIARPALFFADRSDIADPKKRDRARPITADQALGQARAALWLLCYFGGVGSKAAKGLGALTFRGRDDSSLDAVKSGSGDLRSALGFGDRFDDARAASAALDQMLGPETVRFGWPDDAWSVVDQIGFSYQSFMKKWKHRREKMALGLPRVIGSPAQGVFRPRPPVRNDGRHASPVHIHVEVGEGDWTVRFVAFPAARLPDLATSRAFLEAFLKHFKGDLETRSELPAPRPLSHAGERRAARPAQSHASAASLWPEPKDRVEAVLLDERTKRGGWRAKHEPSELSGPVQNTHDVPDDRKAGDRLTLIVASANEREIAFRYPTAADEERAKITRGALKGGPGRQRPRGRR